MTTNEDNKGNWEFSFFQKKENKNIEAQIKKLLETENKFNPKYINDYINIKLSKEEELLLQDFNKLSTSDKIIVNNYKNNQKKLLDNDIELLKKYKVGAKPQTKEGKTRLLLEILDFELKKGNKELITNIYLRLKEEQFNLNDNIKKDYEKQIKYMNNIVDNEDLIKLQFTKFHSQMPPLNENGFKKLDDWQINVINNINNNISTIVNAPTSSGKSILSGYAAIKGRCLFILPTEALSWQMASYIESILNTQVPILTNSYQSKRDRNEMIDLINKTNVLVGTSQIILDYLPYINNNFKWIIMDEIHMLGKEEGYNMELIIKTLNNIPFLALSATIGNNNELLEWFRRISPELKIDLVLCNKKFFNLQNYYYDNSLKVLHPLSLVNKEEFKNNNINLLPTPPDIWDLTEKLLKIVDLKELNPYKYFDKYERIELTKAYDYFKKLINYMKINYNKDIGKIIDSYKIENINIDNTNLYDLLFTLKKENKNPSIIFQKNSVSCLKIIRNLAIELETKEKEKYPKLILERLKQQKINKKLEKQNDKNIIDEKQTKKIMKQSLKQDEIYTQSIQEPHIDFILNDNVYFTEEKINEWSDELKNYFPKIGDEYHFLIKLLWRGIGVYVKGLPDRYLRLVQTLSNNKKLGIVFSDESLVFGISMPFRTVILYNDKSINDDLDYMLYHQMIGRAGRRGLDKQGNIIYMGYSWDRIKELSLSNIPDITKTNKIIYNIDNVNKLSNNIKTNYNFNKIIENNFNNIEYKKIDINIENDNDRMFMIWRLRENNNIKNINEMIELMIKIFNNKNYILEKNQIDLSHFLSYYINVEYTNDNKLFLPEFELYNMDKERNIDNKIYISINDNNLYTCKDDDEKDKLRIRLFNFGENIKYVQHYIYQKKYTNLTKLLGKLLTRIWWTYHNSSPVMKPLNIKY
jgi:superfamily II RNA helicase